MKPALLLRLAALVALVQSLGHGLKHATYQPKHGADEDALVAAMKAHHFVFAGFDRTYWDFYFGYGLIVAFGCLVQAVALWLLASLAQVNAAALRPLLAMLVLANLAAGTLTLGFFFLLPVIFYAIIAACLAGAFLVSRSPAG